MVVCGRHTFRRATSRPAVGFFVHGWAPLDPRRAAVRRDRVRPARLGAGHPARRQSRGPSRDLPRAVIISILIGAALYATLRFAFIGSLDPRLLADHVWTGLGAGSSTPDRRAQRRPVLRHRQRRGPRVDRVHPAHGRLRLAVRQRPDLPDHVVAHQPRAVAQRLHPAAVRAHLRAHARPRLRRPVLDRDRPAVPAPVPELEQARRDRDERIRVDVRVRAAGPRRAAQGKPELARAYRLQPPACSPRSRSCAPPGSCTGPAGRP